MSDNLACARATEALEWLSGYDPDDGHGVVGAQALDALSMFTQQVVVAAFVAGADHADRARLGRVEHLDLIRDQPGLECGERRYTDRGDVWPLYDTRCRLTDADKWRIQFQEEGRQARRDGQTTADCPHFPKVPGGRDLFPGVNPGAEWMAGWHEEDSGVTYGSFGRDVPTKSNVRPVTDGPLADPAVVEELAGVVIYDNKEGRALSTLKAGAFRLQTPDPRFDPAKPVVVNGYLFTPATED